MLGCDVCGIVTDVWNYRRAFKTPVNIYIYIYIYSTLYVYININLLLTCGPGISVGVATELRAGRSEIASRWGRDSPPVQTGPGAHPASSKMGTGSFPGEVRPERAADHSPPTSAAVMEE